MTPGLGAAGHILRFSKRLIKEDLPTFGYPTIPARTFKQKQGTTETINKVIRSSLSGWLLKFKKDQEILTLHKSATNLM